MKHLEMLNTFSVYAYIKLLALPNHFISFDLVFFKTQFIRDLVFITFLLFFKMLTSTFT